MLGELTFTRAQPLDGVKVHFLFVTSEERAIALQRLTETAELLKVPGARPRGAWGAYIKRLIVWSTNIYLANWYDPLRTCNIDVKFLVNPATSIPEIAATLLHEAQHARLYRLGVRYRPGIWERTEALCLRAEIAFLETLPGVEAATQRRRELKADIPRWWDPKQRLDRGLADLRTLGTPEWLVRAVDRLARKRAG